MTTRIDDHWLWLGTSVVFLATTEAIRYAIRDTISLTELEPDDGKIEDAKAEQPEDCTEPPEVLFFPSRTSLTTS